MNSSITIYKTKITLERNARVDNIETYLSGCEKVQFPLTQFLKNAVRLNYKLAVSQVYSFGNNGFNYLKVETEGKSTYYFILSSKWKSQNCVELELYMDTVNSYNDIEFSANTKIIRQHKDRFHRKNLTEGNNTLYRIVDNIPEGLSSVKIKSGNVIKMDSKFTGTPVQSYLNSKWYFVYFTTDEPRRFIAFIVPEIEIDYAKYTETQTELGTLESIDSWDRTNQRIYKIVELPYCPFELRFASDRITIPNYFTTSTVADNKKRLSLDLVDFEKYDLHSYIEDVNVSDLMTVNIIKNDNLKNISASDYYESKLYNSEFFTRRIFYDSSEKDLYFENLNASREFHTKFETTFIPSKDISSDLAFKMTNSVYSELTESSEYIFSNRNNEKILISDDYLNYIRNGYNYDKKALDRKAVSSTILTGAVGVGSVAVATTASNPYTLPLALLSVAVGLTKNVIDAKNSQRDLEQKVNLLKQNPSSINVANNLSILKATYGNNLNYCDFKITENYKKAVYNLFRLIGYADGTYNSPQLNSRYWFNFIQCEPKFIINEDNELLSDGLDDLRERYKAGVTIYHEHSGVYDFEQEKENFESWIIGE